MEFRVLGPLEVIGDGESLPLGGAKQRGLLAILLLNANRIVSTDRLIDELWGAEAPDTAAKAVQVHVSQLRKVLEPERRPGRSGRMLITRPPGYVLELDSDQLDLLRFEGLAAAGRGALAANDPAGAAEVLRNALELWRGPPLADLAYSDFAQREAPRLEEMRLDVVADRIQADLDCGRHAEVIGELERLVGKEPLRERPRAQLMLALYRSGRQAEALDCYRDGRRALVEGLGIEPGRELRQLEAAILEQDPSLDPRPVAAEQSRPSEAEKPSRDWDAAVTGLCPVLVRRDAQLAALEDAVQKARRGHGGVIVLAGEAGIGKTRLTSELARGASRLGSQVMWGACSEAELSLPYLPFVEAIGNYLSERDVRVLRRRLGASAGELSQLFPQLSDGRPPEPSADPGQTKLRLFESIISLLEFPASDRSLLLVVEDVHWTDDSSRELLDHIARRVPGMRALVLVTCRSEDVHHRHAFAPTLQAWRRSGLAQVIELAPLPRDGIAEMLAMITEIERVDPGLVDVLYERTEGNPFFIEELLSEAAAGLERGADLERETIGRVGIPETVRETIVQRLGRLDKRHTEILEIAAVIGRSFSYATLLASSDEDEDVVQDALASALRARLIEEQPESPGRYRWRHSLTEEAVKEEIVTPRRRAIHSRAADVLAADESARAIEVANHLLWSERFDEAVPVCLEAADQAERASAFRDAASLLERTLPHIDDPLDRARLVCRIGRDLALNGEPRPAERFLSDGIQALDDLNQPLEAARYRIVLARCHWEHSQPDLARVEYEQARDVLAAAGPSAELAMAQMRLAGLHLFALDIESGLEASRNAVEIAQAAGADFERILALSFLGVGHIDVGEAERGLEILDACSEEALAREYWQMAQHVTWNDIWSRVQLRRGDLDRRVARIASLPTTPFGTVLVATARSYVNLARGELEAARREAELVIGLDERLGIRKMAWRARVQLAEVLVELGDYEKAIAVLPPPSERTELQDIIYDAAAQIRSRLARGEIAAALDMTPEILDHAGELAAHGNPLTLAVEALLAAKDFDGAEAVLERARAGRAHPGSSFLDEMRGRILLSRGEGSRAIPLLRATVEAAKEEGYVLVELRARALLAEAYGVNGDKGGSAKELTSVVTQAERLQARRIADEARASAQRMGIEVGEVESGPVATSAESRNVSRTPAA